MKKQIYILKDVESGSFDDVTTDNFYLLVDESLSDAEVLKVVLSAPNSDIELKTKAEYNVMDFNGKITEVLAECDPDNPPTGSNIEIDILKNGTSILSTKLTIDISEYTSQTATTQPVISDTSLSKGDVISWNITGRGSINRGQWLKSSIIINR